MKQQVKNSQTRRPRRPWLLLALPWLLKPAVSQAQELILPDSTGLVHLALPPDSLVVIGPMPVDSARLLWLRTPPTVRDMVGDRMSCLETDAPRVFNDEVMRYVTYFTSRNRAYTQRVLEREQLYFPLFEKYLAKYGLPTDLKYLAVVESALIPTAKSPVGATGLWQFMGPTAGDLNLHRDEWVDERIAPEKATEAACKHLRYLYGVFHDWELSLAAYNWGAGSVQRAMRRSGKKNFWDLYPHMPAETRNYVPTFTAIMYSMKYAEAHGLHSDKLSYQRAEELDTLGLRGQPLDLGRLSRACGYTDSTALTRYNPELKKGWLPAGYRPYALHFPAAARPVLASVDRATLLSYCAPPTALPQPLLPLAPRLQGVEPFPTKGALLAASSGPRAGATDAEPRFRKVRHTVRSRETLAAVAGRYEVSQTQLRRWNDLPKGHTLRPGQKLVVFVPLPAVAPAAPAVAAAPAPAAVQPLLTAEEVARRELAAANAREAARLQEVAREEKAQAARLAAVRQRQAVQQAAAEAEARAAARRLAQAKAADKAAEKAAESKALADAKTAASKAAPVAAAAPAEEPASPTPDNVDANGLYTVQRGDNLTKLARENNLTVAQIMAWNQLESENILLGQSLRLRAADAEEAAPATAAKATPATRETAAAPAKSAARPPVLKTHQVQRGDTLYNISRRFGVTVEALRRANDLKSDEVQLGQKLLVPQG